MLHVKHLILALVLLALAGAANAGLIVTSAMDELGLNEVSLPAHTSGYVTFRPCPTCEPVRRQVSLNTVYELNDDPRPMGLREFLAVARATDRGALYVSYDLETGIVNRIILSVMD